MRTYNNQFTINEEHPLYIPSMFLEDWEDISWGNEICPRFRHEELGLSVWIDYDRPDDRECEDYKKYTVIAYINFDEGILAQENLLETNNVARLIDFFVDYQIKKAINTALDALSGALHLAHEPGIYAERTVVSSHIEMAIDELSSASSPPVSFIAFQEDKVYYQDMTLALEQAGVSDFDGPGYVYEGYYCIIHMEDGKWLLQLNNNEEVSSDLENLERKLYAFYSAGY